VALLALLVGVAALAVIGLTARIVAAQSRRLLAEAPRRRRAMRVPAPVAPPAARIAARWTVHPLRIVDSIHSPS